MHCDAQDDKADRAERRRLEEVARIKAKLIVAKLTLAKIDELYNLRRGTAGNAVHEPHLAGERAIAAALKTRPHLLWRTRYYPDGTRRDPQPSHHYRHARRDSHQVGAAA
ncbi:helix-turn-helix domain-containing protein [Oryzifoliimicrobium ureilyticus]|uniref:helix-turn-helix domain-containing protein n=1 Tax=Oryzifoliimicrobium ureilyticus TaxID=3113724 RepID=UPI0030760A4E